MGTRKNALPKTHLYEPSQQFRVGILEMWWRWRIATDKQLEPQQVHVYTINGQIDCIVDDTHCVRCDKRFIPIAHDDEFCDECVARFEAADTEPMPTPGPGDTFSDPEDERQFFGAGSDASALIEAFRDKRHGR